MINSGERGGSMWSKSIHYSQWFQPLICLMWYDILPRWLLVSFIHINEHRQLADWDKFPPSFLVLRQWNLVAITNQGHLSILTCYTKTMCIQMWYQLQRQGVQLHEDTGVWFLNGFIFKWKVKALTCDRHLTVCQHLKANQNAVYKINLKKVDLASPVPSMPVSMFTEKRVSSMQFSWIAE